jgi:hypothetical protein
MSLINDALNRARTDAARTRALERGEIPPPPVASKTPLITASVLSAAAGVALVLLILFLWPEGRATPETPSAGGDRTGPEAATSEPSRATQAEPDPMPGETRPDAGPAVSVTLKELQPAAELNGVKPIPEPPTATVDIQTAEAESATARSAETEPASEQMSTSSDALAGDPGPSAPAAIRPADGHAAETWYYVGVYTLPDGGRIELGGIVWSPSTASAMLNGALLVVGSDILGLRVTDIEPRTVMLSARQGPRIALQLGSGRDEGQ